MQTPVNVTTGTEQVMRLLASRGLTRLALSQTADSAKSKAGRRFWDSIFNAVYGR
jgi:hypothetical protein